MPTLNGVDYTDAQIAAFCAQDLDCPKFDTNLVNLLQYLRDRACANIFQRSSTSIVRVPSTYSDARTETQVFTETYTRKYENSCLLILTDISHYMEITNLPESGSNVDLKGQSRVLIRFDGGTFNTAVQNRINAPIAPSPVIDDIVRASTSGNFAQQICGTESQVTIDLGMIVDQAAVARAADETLYTEGSGLYGHSIVAPSAITIIETEIV